MNERIKIILNNWIEKPEEFDLVKVTRGATHETFRVSFKSKSYFLRCYGFDDRNRVNREYNLLEELKNTNIPVAPLIQTQDGHYVVKNEGKLYALFEGLEGTHVESNCLSAVEARTAGVMLANLHKALGTFDKSDFKSWPLCWDGEAWAKRFDKILSAIESEGLNEAENLCAFKRAKAMQEWLRNKDCVHEYSFKYPAQLIHGDFHHHNLLFSKNGKVSGILDWDSVMWMPRTYEIVRACAFMFNMNVILSIELIQAYREVYPTSIDELDDGAKGWACFSDHHVWPLEERYLKKNIAASGFIPNAPFEPFLVSWVRVKESLLAK